MMRALVYWSGCSCGCTPVESIEVTSETRDGLLWGMAVKANEYRIRGKDPYAKVGFGDVLPETEKEAFELAKKLADFDDRIHEKDKEIDTTFLCPFICRKGYELTPEQKEVNRKAKEENVAKNKAIEAEKAAILAEKLSLKRGDYDWCHPHSDDED